MKAKPNSSSKSSSKSSKSSQSSQSSSPSPSNSSVPIEMQNYAYFQFPSKSCNESFARASVACFLAQLDPTLEEVNDIKTAVSEAVTNAIVHAYPDEIGKIVMKLRLYPDYVLELLVQDWGVGIPDVPQARSPLYTTGKEERAGMGFTIMETFMDSLKVRSQVGEGTIVLMRRSFQRRACP